MIKLFIRKICTILFLLILAAILYEILGIDQAKQFSDHLFTMLVLEIALGFSLLTSLYHNYFKYKRPKWFWELVVGQARDWQMKRRFDIICEQGKEEEQQRMLVEIALGKVSSTERDKKMLGVQHLYQLNDTTNAVDYTEYIYRSLLDILKTESDGLCKKIIVEAICHFHKRLYP